MKKKLLLIGLDSFDWKVIDPLLKKGFLPNLEKLIQNGSFGQLETLDKIYKILWVPRLFYTDQILVFSRTMIKILAPNLTIHHNRAPAMKASDTFISWACRTRLGSSCSQVARETFSASFSRL